MVWVNINRAAEVARQAPDSRIIAVHIGRKRRSVAKQLAKELFGYRGYVLDSGDFLSIVRMPYKETH